MPPQPIPRRSLDCGLVGRGTACQPATRYPCQGCAQRSSRQCSPALCRLCLPSCAGDLAASSRGVQGRANHPPATIKPQHGTDAPAGPKRTPVSALALALCFTWNLRMEVTRRRKLHFCRPASCSSAGPLSLVKTEEMHEVARGGVFTLRSEPIAPTTMSLQRHRSRHHAQHTSPHPSHAAT